MAPKVAAQALKLPEAERAALAVELIDSLSPEVDPEASKLWEEELLRRADDVRLGRVKGVSWDGVQRRVSRSLRGIRAERR
jgi:putative addiction module component (TIGR02574 family)